jgi:GntR family transcriptional regulator / MocR family aminotransferase
MSRWEMSFEVDRRGDEPLFLQLARAVAGDVRRGRLKAGAALPGSRALARRLGVHRNTVLAAYAELEAEGWIEGAERRGMFVSPQMPEAHVPVRPAASHDHAAFTMQPAPAARDLASAQMGELVLSGGMPDVRLVPMAALARAYRRGLRRRGRELLGYGDPRGHVRLRTALAEMLTHARGLAAGPDDLLITRGSQMAIHLATRTLLGPGDRIAVESWGYMPAWETFRAAGAELLPVAVDGDGLVVDELERVVKRKPIRAVYVTPHHQYPTTVVLTAARRMQLLELARRHRFAIIEDDYHHEFQYEGRPVLPLASADPYGVVCYLGSLSKVLAPGLRIGFLVGPRPLLERATAHRLYLDRQGDLAVEHAVAELLEDGELQRHIRRARRVYLGRRDLFCAELTRRLGDALTFAPPAGGMAVWARARRGLDVDAWSARARARGAVFLTGRSFAYDGRARPFVRLGFAGLDDGELREAVARLRAAL